MPHIPPGLQLEDHVPEIQLHIKVALHVERQHGTEEAKAFFTHVMPAFHLV